MKGEDQLFLAREIYPHVRDDAWIQSSFARYPGETVHPFPCPRGDPNDFVGNVFDVNDEPKAGFADLLVAAAPVLLPLPVRAESLKNRLRRHIRVFVNKVNGKVDCLTDSGERVQ